METIPQIAQYLTDWCRHVMRTMIRKNFCCFLVRRCNIWMLRKHTIIVIRVQKVINFKITKIFIQKCKGCLRYVIDKLFLSCWVSDCVLVFVETSIKDCAGGRARPAALC